MLKREQVLKKAIELAENGVASRPAIVSTSRNVLSSLDKITRSAGSSWCKTKPVRSKPPQSVISLNNQILPRRCAPSLNLSEAFYQGDIANALSQDMQSRKGIVSKSDLKNYKVRYREPLVGSYRGHAVVSSPPPSSGGQIILSLLNVMEQAPLHSGWRNVDNLHLYIEASKRVFADRALLGDPDYLSYLPGLVPHLIAKDRGPLLAHTITERATPSLKIAPAQGTSCRCSS